MKELVLLIFICCIHVYFCFIKRTGWSVKYFSFNEILAWCLHYVYFCFIKALDDKKWSIGLMFTLFIFLFLQEHWTTLIEEDETAVMEWTGCVSQTKLVVCYLRDVKVLLYWKLEVFFFFNPSSSSYCT